MKRKSSLLRLLAMTRPYILPILLCLLCMVLVNGGELLKPYILKTVIDDFLVARRAGSGLYSAGGLGAAYFLVVLLGAGLTVVQVNVINTVGQKIVHTLRSRVFSHVQAMPLKALDKYSSGRLVTRGTNDVEAVSSFFTNVLLGLLRDAFLLAGIVVTMLSMNVRLSLISFTILPLIVLTIWLMRRTLKPMYVRVKSLTGRINGFFAENIAGMGLVQAMNAQPQTMGLFRDLNGQYYRATLLRVLVNSINRPIIDVINTLAVCIILWYSTGPIALGALPIGLVYAFTSYIRQFFEPIMDFAEQYDTIQSAETSADRIFELLDQREDLEDMDEGLPLKPPVTGRIEFKNVWFAYNEPDWVLKDVSFTVEPGQTVALVGQTGSGKTTIINLLVRFYEIQKGQILLDGVDIRTLKLQDLRQHVAMVLQDPFLFSGTVRDNIDLSQTLSEPEIWECVYTAGISPFIESLPLGLDQPVTERGATFSAGQRQLLAFARALSQHPDVLVLDEATAHIDTQTEQMLQQSLARARAGRTLIIVAHRLSTIEGADMILVLHRGRIVERGTHAQLLAAGGAYARLHAAKLREKEM